jgi:hypothetical protein
MCILYLTFLLKIKPFTKEYNKMVSYHRIYKIGKQIIK